MAAELGGDGLLHLVVGDGDRRQLDPQAGVAGHDDRGAHLDGGVEGDRALLLAGGDVDLGRGDDVDVVLLDRVGQVAGDGVLQGLLPGGREADAGLQDPPRRLARAEAGEPHLAGDLAERDIDVPVELGLVHLDRSLTLLPSRVSTVLFTGRRVYRRTGPMPVWPRA